MSHYAKLALPAPTAGGGRGGTLITPAVGRPSAGGGGVGVGGSSKGINIHAAHVAAFSLAAENIVDTALASTAQQVHRADASDDVLASASALLNKSTKVLAAGKAAQASIRAEAEKSASVSLTIHTHIATVARGESSRGHELLQPLYLSSPSTNFLSPAHFRLLTPPPTHPPHLLLPPRSSSGVR